MKNFFKNIVIGICILFFVSSVVYGIYGIIKTKERMTYEDVTKILDGDKELCKKYEHILDDLYLMQTLALILKGKRLKKGGIDFDFPETKIELDENGRHAVKALCRVELLRNKNIPIPGFDSGDEL